MMLSSGIRLGAWDYLKWGHVTKLEGGVAARVKIYSGEPDAYYTYITPEAYNALEEWMDFRKMAGETVTKDSWLMRNLWDCRGATTGKGVATIPTKLHVNGLRALVQNAIRMQGLRTRLEPGKHRYEFHALHGFRKYFETRAQQVMKPINVKILMGHSIGISDSYYRPTEQDLLEDYLKAVPLLTIERQSQQEAASIEADRTRDEKIENLEKLVKGLIKSGQMQEM
jgi:integrase